MKPVHKIKQIVERMEKNLEDAMQTNGKPMCIYYAYKTHLLIGGIHTLELVSAQYGLSENQALHELVSKYKNELNELLFNI
jgi:hypothetical protein